MIICAMCNAENIEGADSCESCGQPFSTSHLLKPASEVERRLLQDRVGVLTPRTPIVVTPDTKVQAVLDLLIEKRIGCVLIVDAGKLVGIFSERDALMRINTAVDQYADRPISDVMTKRPKQLPADVKVAFAVHSMDLGGVRHLPVIGQDGKPEGIISVRDILQYLTEQMSVTN